MISLLVLVQWVALGQLFHPHGVFVNGVTAPPLASMAVFYLASLALCTKPSGLASIHLAWRCLFAVNAGCAIAMVPLMMRASACTTTSFASAATLALQVYGPVLLNRLFLFRSDRVLMAAKWASYDS
jgi:hypothetical protein